ncbi:hypothetical protein Lser_V15G32374 [Lactuca serriola]
MATGEDNRQWMFRWCGGRKRRIGSKPPEVVVDETWFYDPEFCKEDDDV